MFGALDNYLDKEWFFAHPDGTLFIGDAACPFKAYAVLVTDASTEEVFSPTEVSQEDVADFIREHAMFYNEELEPLGKECILGLSTCKHPDTAERTIVFCTFDPGNTKQ